MSDIGVLSVASLANYLPMLSDAIVNDNVLLSKIKEGGKIEYGNGGNGLSMDVRYQGSTIGGSTTIMGINAGTNTAPFKTLTNVYRPYRWDIQTLIFQDQLMNNANTRSKKFDGPAQQLAEVKQQASARLGTHMYTGTTVQYTGDNGTNIDGLEDIVDDDNTYFGQARSGNTWWQANVDTMTAAAFNVDADNDGTQDGLTRLQTLYRTCSKGGSTDGAGIKDQLPTTKDEPDFIVTTSTNFGLYEKTLMPQYRYTDGKADPKKMLLLEGAEMRWDSFCTSGAFYLLNLKHMEFHCVGKQLIEEIIRLDVANPLSKLITLGGQYQFLSRNPRYLGVMRLT